MSVQSEIDRINGNVASTYSALSEMGATMPSEQNSNNLPGTVRTVPQGGGSGGKTVQTDYLQNDETAPDYLKNRPFYSIEIVLVEEQTYTPDTENGAFLVAASSPAIGDEVTVIYDGVVYKTTVFALEASPSIGNEAFIGGTDTGEPFVAIFIEGMLLVMDVDGSVNHTIKCIGENVEKIPPKYYHTGLNTFYVTGISGTEAKYLRADIAGSVKVSKSDFVAALKNGVRLSLFDVEYMLPVQIDVSQNVPYATAKVVRVLGDGTCSTFEYVTSEYPG